MKKKFMTILMVAVISMLVFANFAFADDVVEQNVDVRTGDTNVSTSVTANPTATGGDAFATGGNAEQRQRQLQEQQQKQQQKQTVTGVKGTQTVTTPLQAPLMGAIVGPGGAEIGKVTMLICNPAYQVFNVEELENMSDSGRFSDRRGSFFDAFSSMKVKSVIRSKKAKATNNEIRILNEVPTDTRVLGTFSCTGDYGWGTDEILSKCLLEARAKTNTSNVVVYQTNDIDAANSGTAIGAGASMSNPFSEGSVGAGSVGASFGKTHSFKNRIVLLEVHAYDDVYEDYWEICNPKQPEPQVIAPPPTLVPQPKCSDEYVRELYRRLEENRVKIYGDKQAGKKGCDDYCNNNLGLRTERGDLFYEVYNCTGDGEALKEAIRNYEIAARNYKFGVDIKKNQTQADATMARVYENWAKAKKEVAK